MQKDGTKMNIFGQYKRAYSLFMSIFVLSALMLASCTSNAGNAVIGQSTGSKGCTRVGILLPDFTTSTRWETKDHPLLIQAVKAAIPGVHIDYNNAHDNSATQLTQAEQDLANGDCILIVAPHDSVAGAAIVTKARAVNVPVIAYDRLIESKYLNYYVSFDGVKVGELQGQYIADHYLSYEKDGQVNMAVISGSQTDENALLFSQGLHVALDPLLASGALKIVYETFTPDWNASTAQSEMDSELAATQNNIQIAYAANDDMADTVIAALKTAGLAGNVIVTGQDATITGIHNILTGEQSMTVYKPIAHEAQSTGALVKALYEGTAVKTLTKGATTATFDGGNIPSILDAPIAVDAGNIASTVIADQYVTKSEVCAGIPAGTDKVC